MIKNERYFKVVFRPDIGVEISLAMEKVNGKVYLFQFGWFGCEMSLYKEEDIWVPVSKEYPDQAPEWISREDLILMPNYVMGN